MASLSNSTLDDWIAGDVQNLTDWIFDAARLTSHSSMNHLINFSSGRIGCTKTSSAELRMAERNCSLSSIVVCASIEMRGEWICDICC
uniref:Uncharacterized protein n=1 Tax=Caenorhabditis japonica TaxID=281687 RepID=A0A8R1E1Z7_CAEJA